MDEVDMSPLSQETRKASAKTRREDREGKEAVLATVLRDAAINAGKPLTVADESHGYGVTFPAIAAEAQQASNLRQQCARVLKRSDNDSWRRRLSAGRIDRRAYRRLAIGDYTNPYAKHSHMTGYETEIVIILDGSDSMS